MIQLTERELDELNDGGSVVKDDTTIGIIEDDADQFMADLDSVTSLLDPETFVTGISKYSGPRNVDVRVDIKGSRQWHADLMDNLRDAGWSLEYIKSDGETLWRYEE